MVQEVTIQEFFSETRQQQKDLTYNKAIAFAREYVKRNHNIHLHGVFFVTYIRELSKQGDKTIKEIIFDYANKELNHLIEVDLLEFVAEQGVNTHNAVRLDFIRAKQERIFYERNGYMRADSTPSRIKELKNNVELYIVEKSARPLVNIVNENAFVLASIPNDDDESPFKDNLKAEKKSEPIVTNRPKISDYDDMSEEEWQQQIAKDQQYSNLNSKIRSMAIDAEKEERRAQAALNLIDEYPDHFIQD